MEEAVTILQHPSVKEALNALRKALSSRRVILLVGSCRVDYRGRAESKLELGDRVVLIKEDGSLLVHRPYGYEPVNWQPPGCMFQAGLREDCLQIRAVRRAPRESVSITFNRVYLLAVLRLVDAGAFALHATEEDMQRAVLLEPSLIEEGLRAITYEKRVEPGFIDVYAVDSRGRLVVVEIKRGTAGREAALQLHRYVQHVRATANQEVRGILAAPRLAKGVQRLLTNLNLEFKRLDPKKCAEVLKRAASRRLTEFVDGGSAPKT